MSEFYTLVTAAGQAKLAAFAAGGSPVSLARISVGDANGVAYTPNEAQTTLIHEIWRTSAIAVSTTSGAVIVAEAVIAADLNDDLGRPSGGFSILEAGLWDNTGVLIAIAKMPQRYKPLPSSGAADDMTIRLVIDVGATGAVTVTVAPDAVVTLNRLPRTPFIAVISAITTSPPGGSANGDTYLIPAGATGAWAGKADQLAQYYGGAWVFADPPVRTIIGVANGGYLERAASGWVSAAFGAPFASDSGVSNAYVATLNPARLSYGIGQRTRFVAGNTNTGASTLNVNSLGAKAIKRRDGSALQAGDIPAGSICEVTYDGANFQLTTGTNVSGATEAVAGIVELASAAEAIAGVDVQRAVHPAGLAAAIAQAIANLVASAPGALNTLDELAAALGDDANFAATVTAALGGKAPLFSPALTGAPTAPTPSAGSDGLPIANTAWVKALLTSFAKGTTVVDGASMPQGTVFRWVRAAVSSGNFISFSSAFPNACLGAVVANRGSDEAADIALDDPTITGVQLNVGGVSPGSVFIFAWGY